MQKLRKEGNTTKSTVYWTLKINFKNIGKNNFENGILQKAMQKLKNNAMTTKKKTTIIKK